MYFEGMNNSEKARLTDDEVNRRIDLECAQQGIPLFIEEMQVPLPPVAPDMTLFKVADILFENEADALRVRDAINASRRWKMPNWYSDPTKVVQHDDPIEMLPHKAIHPSTAHKHQAALAAFEQMKSEYQRRRSENDEAIKARTKVAEKVWSEVNESRRIVRSNEEMCRLFIRYIDLANGDQTIARNFLIAAKKLGQDWVPDPELAAQLAVLRITGDKEGPAVLVAPGVAEPDIPF